MNFLSLLISGFRHFGRFLDWIIKDFFLKLVILVFLVIAASFAAKQIPVLVVVTGLVPTIYIVLASIGLIKKSIHLLLHDNKTYLMLFFGYIGGIFSIILLFSLLYGILTSLGLGYLTYSPCHDTFTTGQDSGDPNAVHSIIGYVYFSAITFFTVGYGDVCAMGSHRVMAVFNAFAGHFYTSVIIVLALSTGLGKKRRL